jgi:hypothetical protein
MEMLNWQSPDDQAWSDASNAAGEVITRLATGPGLRDKMLSAVIAIAKKSHSEDGGCPDDILNVAHDTDEDETYAAHYVREARERGDLRNLSSEDPRRQKNVDMYLAEALQAAARSIAEWHRRHDYP